MQDVVLVLLVLLLVLLVMGFAAGEDREGLRRQGDGVHAEGEHRKWGWCERWRAGEGHLLGRREWQQGGWH